MIYAGHHLAERVPQNGRYFQFLRIALISTFSRSPYSLALFLFLFPLHRSFTLTRTSFIPTFSLASLFSATRHPSCALPPPPLPFRRSLTYYWKAIVFSRRRFSYGAAIFHDPILERREHEARRVEGGRQG